MLPVGEPIVPPYQITHQWTRELRRFGRRTVVAVDFRIPDDEPVHAGHYGRGHVRVSSAEAAALILEHDDPRGYEVFVPRAIAAGEIRRIRPVNQVTGWRYRPDAHGTPPCPLCVDRGEYGGAKIRRAAGVLGR
ncbi:hypothetical protein GCM10010466_18680 [Planomonospora alba]|uniref:Uncharacterized protein n=1 Tax=Planomonospora alba TaxID=161354 RepID=A0ABP6MYH4_9ACTN